MSDYEFTAAQAVLREGYYVMSRQASIESRSTTWPEQLAVRIARYYYVLGLTQMEIADIVGISRTRVIRLLADARQRGVVSIRINSPLLENEELAEALVTKFGLKAADVCLSHASDEYQLAHQIGAASGDIIRRHIHDSMSVGLGWGITLKEFVDQFDILPCKDVSVVSLLGSLTRRSSVTRFEATTELAARLDAECLYLPAPIVCDSAATRGLLTEQPLFQDIFNRALKTDLAIVSIGGLDSATIRLVDLISDEEFNSVRAKGAIGNFLGYYIDEQGELVDHPINDRIIGIQGNEFMRIPRRFMLSAGESKVRALRAVLSQGYCTDLVTDQKTARALLK
ncbi:MAG: sugar-binding transcriptional regulator [Granulosicoccus sp.]